MSSENRRPSSPARQFKVKRTSFTRHYEIHDNAGRQVYHVDQSVFTRDKPNLTFHEGKDARGPVVAVAHMPRFSADCKVGLGDAAKPDAVRWEDLTRASAKASEYRWAMTVPALGRRDFVWKRTHNVGVDGASPWAVTMRSYKLLDVGTGRLMAVFTSDRGFLTCGVLQINVGYGRDFDVMVTATCVSLYERARKRAARAARAAGGHGGGL